MGRSGFLRVQEVGATDALTRHGWLGRDLVGRRLCDDLLAELLVVAERKHVEKNEKSDDEIDHRGVRDAVADDQEIEYEMCDNAAGPTGEAIRQMMR